MCCSAYWYQNCGNPFFSERVTLCRTKYAMMARRGERRAAQSSHADFHREATTMSAGKLTSAIAAVCTAIALGTAAGQAQELEQVQTVFAHALSHIAGKSLIALVVTHPPGGTSPSHRHAG